LPVHSGVMLTGSHNSKDYNGIKIVLRQRSLADDQITRIRQRIDSNELSKGAGTLTRYDIANDYIKRVTSDIKLQRRYRIVVDAGNGVTGLVAPRLFERLGCEVIQLFCNPDGNFP